MMTGFTFQTVKTTLVAPGGASQLIDLLVEREQISAICDRRMLIQLGVVTPVINALKKRFASVAVFDGIEPDPSEECC